MLDLNLPRAKQGKVMFLGKRTKSKKGILLGGLVLFFCLFVNIAFAQTPISCGQLVNESISTAGEKDTYTFPASANDSVAIRATTVSGSLYPYLELYGPDGTNLAKARGQIDKKLTLSGNYTIIVRDEYNSYTGSYCLAWMRLNYPCASVINCGQSFNGSININERFKFYTFTASANDKVTIRAAKTSGGLYAYLELYGPDGTNLAKARGQIDKALSLSGPYTIIVRDEYNSYTGNYFLIWVRLNDPCFLSTACGKNITGSISTDGWFKFYTFTASANDKVTIRAAKTSGGLYAYLELYGPDGTNLAKARGQIDKALSLSGPYTIIVRDEYNSYTGDYCLIWMRFNNPCAISITPGQVTSGSITATERFKFYTFSGFANDSVTVRATKTSGSLYPYLELYAPDGMRLGTTRVQIDKILTLTGPYTILLRDEYNSYTGNYDLFWLKKNAAPSVGTVIPSSGSSQPNQPVSFITTYSDVGPAGWQDLAEVRFLVNTFIDERNCFCVRYDQNNNKLYLRDDANTIWLGGFAPGSTNVIENSYAKLDCSKTTVSGLDNTLTINWAVTFKFAFNGKTYNTYLYAKDELGVDSGWVQKGTWKVNAIEIAAFLPADKSRFIEGMTLMCSVQAQPADTSYQYQFLVDGKIKRAFSTSNAWDWQATSADIGIHTLTIQVKNQYGAQTEKSCRLIIYRRPMEPQ